MIYRLLTEQPERSVIYSSRCERAAYVIAPGQPARGGKESLLDDMLWLPELASPVLIADSRVPPVSPYPSCIISSPERVYQREHKDSLNHFSAPLYLPVPTEREVLEMRRVAFPHLAEEGVARRLQLWGPIPRHVLAQTDDEGQRLLWGSIRDFGVDRVTEAMEAVSQVHANEVSDGDVPHRIFLVRSWGEEFRNGNPSNDSYYLRGKVDFASPSLARWFLERLVEQQRWQAAFFLEATDTIARTGSLRGFTFKELAIELLRRGGRFKIRRLGGKGAKEREWQVSAQETVSWSSEQELRELASGRGRGCLLLPARATSAAVDALVWDHAAKRHVPVNFSVSFERAILPPGVLSTVSALGWNCKQGWLPEGKKPRQRPAKLMFAVPRDKFEKGWTDTQKAGRETGNGEAEEKAVRANLVQFVLCVDPMQMLTLARGTARTRARMPEELVPLLPVPASGDVGS